MAARGSLAGFFAPVRHSMERSMSCKVLDRFENSLDLLVRRVVINGFLSVCLAAACLMFIPTSGASAQGIRAEVGHHKDMEIYYQKMREELAGAATDLDDLLNEKQGEPNGMDPIQWHNWAADKPEHKKWIDDSDDKD
jgi:hypothetical protein